MGQVFSTETEHSQLKEAIGSALYDAMLQGEAVPDLGVVHPVFLAGQDGSSHPGSHLQQQLRHVKIFSSSSFHKFKTRFATCAPSGLKVNVTFNIKLGVHSQLVQV